MSPEKDFGFLASTTLPVALFKEGMLNLLQWLNFLDRINLIAVALSAPPSKISIVPPTARRFTIVAMGRSIEQ